MNKETKEIHEFVLERLFLLRNDKNLLRKIYYCKDDEISDKIKNLILRRIFLYNKSYNTEQYLKKLSKNKVMQKDIRKKIIEVILGKNENFEENEKVIRLLERGLLDDIITELLQKISPYMWYWYTTLLLMDSFREFYEKKIKLSPSSITFEEYQSKLKGEKEFYTLLDYALKKRWKIIEEQNLIKEKERLQTQLNEFRNLTIKSQELAEQYKTTSIWCFILAFGWFSLCWFVPYQLFQYNYFGEIFIFLSNLLFKLPSFVLCLVGVKFLYLFVQYKTEEREFSMLDSYLEKLPSDCTKKKAELVKQLAPHFFPDKKATKISQGFLQELLRKAMEK